MIQFNLLPDVKLQYIKTRRIKRLVTLVSLAAGGASLALLALMLLTVHVVQKNHLRDVSTDIVVEMKKLTAVPDLDKILTIQNQLSSLGGLHDKKTISSRMLNYVQQVTPVKADIEKLDLDILAGTITFTGKADTLETANKYADTLKFATYATESKKTGKPFSEVVTSITQSQAKTPLFVIVCKFDPILFSSTEKPTLIVPKIISTRSETEKPAAIFKPSPAPELPGPGGN